MKKRVRMSAAAVLTTVVLALVACGGGQEGGTNTSSSQSASAAGTTAQADTSGAGGSAAEVVTGGATLSLNLSSPVGDTHPAITAFNQFVDEVKEGTGGNITISVFPNGALGDQADGIAGLKVGTMNLQHCNSGPAAQVIPELDVFNLPYIFDSGEHIIVAMNGEVGEWTRQKFEENGFHYLGWIYGGSRSIITDVGPVEKPEDLNGLKIRVQSSDTMVAMINAMGGIGTPMAQSEVYSALQQGVIEGWENSVITLQSLSLYEVSHYFSRTEHLINPDFLLMSMSDWEAMSPEQQQLVTDAVDKALAYEIELWLETEADTEKLLEEEGVMFNDADKEAFREACQVLWENYESQYGDEIIKMIQGVSY